MARPRIAILGGGPAGVGAAWKLAREDCADVVLLEQRDAFGGNSGSFELEGHRLDYGSHRLHPASDPEILTDVRALLGDDLLDRPRHGRIRLLGQWIHFPLKPVDLFLRLDKSFALGSTRDLLRKTLAPRPEGDTFASVLDAKLGPTICEHFYFPYAVKLWGHPPQELSGIQARKRVSASGFGKLMRKVLGQVPGLKKPGAGRFYYPVRGFGQISEGYAEAAAAAGADLRRGRRVARLEAPRGPGDPWRVAAEGPAGRESFEVDHVWSTLPLSVLARCVEPAPPPEVQRAVGEIDYRAMILIYAVLPVPRFSEYDAHYFPDARTRITRMSEPKNYAARSEPAGTTVLCAELPCMRGDALWEASDAELGRLFAEDLAGCGIPFPVEPTRFATRRLPQAYPIYRMGYERPFAELERWVETLPRLITYGRQGLFAHDNTHHALYMAYCAVDCLRDGRFDADRWAEHREVFETHVVED